MHILANYLTEFKNSNMEISVLVFGQITDITGKGSLKFTDIKSTGELYQLLLKTYPQLESIKYLMAVNKKIIHENTMLMDEDTIALLPPFSGG